MRPSCTFALPAPRGSRLRRMSLGLLLLSLGACGASEALGLDGTLHLPPAECPAAAVRSAPAPTAGSHAQLEADADMAAARTFAPVLLLYPQEPQPPRSIEALLQGASLVDGHRGHSLVAAPGQADLLRHRGPQVHIRPSAQALAPQPVPAGAHLDAPMYVAVQRPARGDFIDLTYVFLFAFQEAQVFRFVVAQRGFFASVPHFGEHEGDLESLTVRLSADRQRILRVRLEAHGLSTWWEPEHLTLEAGTHVLVRAAHHSHALYNHTGRPVRDLVVLQPLRRWGVGVEAVDLIAGDGARWSVDAPNQLRRIGLDAQGQPLGPELWAAFAGRLGEDRHNHRSDVQSVGDAPLSRIQRAIADRVAAAAVRLGYARPYLRGNSIRGPGARAWVQPQVSAP